MKDVLPLSENEFSIFQKYVARESGIYFNRDKIQFLCLALWERIAKLGYDSYQQYYDLLRFHPQGQLEIRELIDLITIGEAYFFRYKPQFEVLMKFVLPEIVEKKIYSSNKSIRIWSAGCSKGDEPYSIAIAIIETLPYYENWDISILGTDINRNALAKAREAIYSKKDIEQMPKYYLNEYFKKSGTNYILNETVKKLVRFEDHNLAKDAFTLEGMQNLDIIFCRNVTIYFDFQTTRRIIDNFYNCLIQDGYLFIGSAETLWRMTDKFKIVDFPQTFIYKKAPYPVQEEALRPFVGVPEIRLEELTAAKEEVLKKKDAFEESGVELEAKIKPIEQIKKPSETQDKLNFLYKEATELFTEKRYPEALSLFDKILARDINYIQAYFAKATILANQAKYEEAFRELKKIIEMDNLYVEAYYLLGVLSYKIGDFKEAETQFRKVVYIDSSSILAYFNLGNIYLCQKKYSKATKEFKNAVKLLEKRPREESVRFCEDFTVEFLLMACENNLAEINFLIRDGVTQ